MAPIAADETRHAELAWEVAAWAEPRLSGAARRHVEMARSAALADLRNEVSRPLPAPLVSLVGLPDAETAAALLTNLTHGIGL
jgi:hypothetical protein